MAHYLSDVTHLRLELRWNEDEGSQRGITHTHDFTGQIRCMEVIPREAPDVEIWTGDTDGTMTVRHGLDGRPVRAVPPIGYNVFLYCLQYAKPNMWCGRSDGFIQIYDADSFGRVCEFKAHGGAVNCLHHVQSYVVSGGSDWQIVVWNTVTALRVHQFTGHSNGVRCFTKDGFLLYSGADDGVIHCWDMETLTEKAPLWPIKAHEESVRCLVRHEVYLLSCSNDGSIRAWNTQTAQLAKVVDQRHCAINHLMLIPSAQRLWSSSSDGLVTVFDVVSLEQDSTITGHRATNVPVVRQVAAANSTKLWTVSADGKIRVWYNDTEPGQHNTEFAAIAEMEQTLQTHVDACRKRIVHNYHQLERCKEDLLELERRDLAKKTTMGVVFANLIRRAKLMRAVHQVGLAGQQARRREWSALAAAKLEHCRLAAFLAPFFTTWTSYLKSRQSHRAKLALKECVATVAQNALTSRLLQSVASQARHQFAANQLSVKASGCASRNQLTLLRTYFASWVRGASCTRLSAQQVALRACPHTAAAFIRSTCAWSVLSCAQVEVEGHQVLVKSSDRQAVHAGRRLLGERFATWARYLHQRNRQKELSRNAAVVEAGNHRLLLARFFTKWCASRLTQALHAITTTVDQQDQHINYLEVTIAKGTGVSEEDLEQQLQMKQMELARILEECRDLDADIEAKQQEKRLLQRDLLRDYSVDVSLPIVDQLDKSIFFLKARGVNTYHDIQTLATAREDLRKIRADEMVGDGIAHVRKALARYAKPEKLKLKGEPDWYVGDIFSKIKRKGVEKAAVGICRIVLAFDSIDKLQLASWISKDNNTTWDKKHQYAAEVTSNLGPLLELSLRAYRYHRGEDPLTGLPKSAVKKKVRKSYAATSGGKPAKGKSSKNGGKSAGIPKQALKKRRIAKRGTKASRNAATIVIAAAETIEGGATGGDEDEDTARRVGRSAASVDPQWPAADLPQDAPPQQETVDASPPQPAEVFKRTLSRASQNSGSSNPSSSPKVIIMSKDTAATRMSEDAAGSTPRGRSGSESSVRDGSEGRVPQAAAPVSLAYHEDATFKTSDARDETHVVVDATSGTPLKSPSNTTGSPERQTNTADDNNDNNDDVEGDHRAEGDAEGDPPAEYDSTMNTSKSSTAYLTQEF